jgi:mono/diheme cytochrome c family protein
MWARSRVSWAAAVWTALASSLAGGATAAAQLRPPSGKDGAVLYREACAACHGADGRGTPQSIVGFDTALPDFTDCSFASREPAADWFAIAHDGGPVRAFDRRMPAFGEVLASDEIARAVDHVQRFCPDPTWPRGELNLPRPLVTEKAYPEDEAVVTAIVDTATAGSVTHQFLYEKRIGARTQYEVAVPFALQQSAGGAWQRGLGDVALALKHVLAHSLSRGSIVSISGEIVLPTGKETQGLGKGVTVFEPFVTFGQVLAANMFVHAQAGAELSTDRDRAGHEAFWRGAVGRTFEQGRFGRAWSPMVELLGARELEAGERLHWDAVPQMQVTLSRRQHIMVNAGIRLPVTQRAGRRPQVLAYFLWDWYDGGLTDGWR